MLGCWKRFEKSIFIVKIMKNFLSFDFISGVEAFFSWLSPAKMRNASSPGYGRPRAYIFQRSKNVTAVSLCSTLQRAPLRRTSSNSCLSQSPGSSPPCGQTQDSGNTIYFHFSADSARDPPNFDVGRLE